MSENRPETDIAATLLEAQSIRNSPQYRYNDLFVKLAELETLLKRGSAPDAFRAVCKSAADDARCLAQKTQNAAFDEIAEILGKLASVVDNVYAALYKVANTESLHEILESKSQVLAVLLREFGVPKLIEQIKEFVAAVQIAEPLTDTNAAQPTPDPKDVVQTASVTAKATMRLDYPLDKPNAQLWRLATHSGQLAFEFLTGKKGESESVVICALNMDELAPSIARKLTAFDKRVYIASAALWNAGNEIVTATQIHATMGGEGRPAPNQIKKIHDSLTKMGQIRLYLDNTDEAKKTNYPSVKYDAPLLPFERVTRVVNGKLTEMAIHLFREPPLITFAKDRRQVVQIPRKLLATPISKSEQSMLIEDYLIDRISHMRHTPSNRPPKIMLQTLYENCGISTPKQKERAIPKIKTILDHYCITEWITKYTMDSTSVSIDVKPAPKD